MTVLRELCTGVSIKIKKGVTSVTPFSELAILRRLYFCGFFPFGGLSNLELDPFTFSQGTVTITDDFLEVGKYIATTIFFLDEAKSFSTIKPLYCTVSHVSPFKLLFVLGL